VGILPSKADGGKRGRTPSSPTRQEVYRAATTYRSSGLSFIPIRADATKSPAFELLPRVWNEEQSRYCRPWGGYRGRRPTRGEVRAWYRDSLGEYGIAILGGAVSGGLEIIDCDSWDVAERWAELVDRAAPGLLDRLVLVRSPRPGLHAYYRCSEVGGNAKLARVPDLENNKKPKTIIEIKGEGGYCLASPSPAGCHRTGRCYEIISAKNLTQIPTIHPEERIVLIDCARELNEWVEPVRQRPPARTRPASGGCLRPGDDFNRRADWGDILEPHGWRWVRRDSSGCDHWRRPGKSHGTSATTDHAGLDLLYVFSSNADPFAEMTTYSKFSAFTLLEYGGNYRAAARALAARGYGRRRSSASAVALARLGPDVPPLIRRAFIRAITREAQSKVRRPR
jgi:putative DNA primase/helicase